MKIVTVNVPESYIERIEELTGEDGLYPSRSELIRCAVREFLLKELRHFMPKSLERLDDGDGDENLVRIPVQKLEPVTSFTTYKILRRLE